MDAKLIPVVGVEGTEEVPLEAEQPVVLGRADVCTVRLGHCKVSRLHCRISYENGFYTIEDLDSRNGTWVNNRRVKKAILFDHDRITVGGAEFRFVLEGGLTAERADHSAVGGVQAGYSGRRIHPFLNEGGCPMDATVLACLESVEFGEIQQQGNMAVVPLTRKAPPGPRYITLKEAMDGHQVSVLEVSQGGAVPELKVVNRADVAVLLLDGEELVGAKQNRVLNTSILVPAQSEGVVPVSCTEHGRWSYMSAEFAASDAVMSPTLRSRKVRSVSEFLEAARQYRSDQRDVWDSVAGLAAEARVSSSTGAMHDVYRAREADLEAYLKAFPTVDGQKGLLVMIAGKPVGFDLISRPEAYARLHGKLVKSYAMDALFSRDRDGEEPSADAARLFMKEAAGCRGMAHKSVGHGQDHRFQGKAMVGSALVYRQAVIQAAFFRARESDEVGRMSSLGSRRRFRR